MHVQAQFTRLLHRLTASQISRRRQRHAHGTSPHGLRGEHSDMPRRIVTLLRHRPAAAILRHRKGQRPDMHRRPAPSQCSCTAYGTLHRSTLRQRFFNSLRRTKTRPEYRVEPFSTLSTVSTLDNDKKSLLLQGLSILLQPAAIPQFGAAADTLRRRSLLFWQQWHAFRLS